MRDEKKINVVILDDMADNLVLLSRIVTDLGYIARPVINTRLAFAAIEKCHPDLLLLDIAMPDMSGFDFYRRLKVKKEYAKIPVIFVSAYQDIDTKMEAYALGAKDYVTRPFVTEELACRIKNQIQQLQYKEKEEKQTEDLKQILSYKMNLRNQDKKKVLHAFLYMAKQRELIPGRMNRVTTRTASFAKALLLTPQFERELSESFVAMLEEVAGLYDFGMLVIEESVTRKAGGITMAEYERIKEHTTRGIEPLILVAKEDEENEYLKMAVEIAAYHHERYDGRGYPFGLKGEQIPLSARIISIVSVYESLLCDTCYRTAYKKEEAMGILRAGEGTAFDPKLVRIFDALYGNGRLDKIRTDRYN